MLPLSHPALHTYLETAVDCLAAVTPGRPIFLIGPAGSGKTTIARRTIERRHPVTQEDVRTWMLEGANAACLRRVARDRGHLLLDTHHPLLSRGLLVWQMAKTATVIVCATELKIHPCILKRGALLRTHPIKDTH